MKYVALLRGINVGGNNKVEMGRLKSTCESLGLKNVQTYINSGNVLFESSKNENQLEKIIADAIKKEFHLAVPVVVRSNNTMSKLEKEIPKSWTNDAEMKTDVLFLWDEVNDKSILEKIVIKPEIDSVMYIDGAVVWNVKRKDVTKSGLIKIVGTDIYKNVTIRNINTVRKLNELMRDTI